MSDYKFTTTDVKLDEYLPCKFIEVIPNLTAKTAKGTKGSLCRFVDEANGKLFVAKWSNDTHANYEEVTDWMYHPKTGDVIPSYQSAQQKRRSDFELIAELGIPLNMSKGGI